MELLLAQVGSTANVYDVANNLLNVMQTVALAYLAVKAQKIDKAVNGG